MARLLESILVVAGRRDAVQDPTRRATPRIGPALREARICHDLMAEFGTAAPQGGRGIFCRPCLDWSERRSHRAGTIGAAL